MPWRRSRKSKHNWAFELTMLGAIVATVITLVITAGFWRGKGRLYDPEVSDGKSWLASRTRPTPAWRSFSRR